MTDLFITLGTSRKRGYSADGINWTVDVVGADLPTNPSGSDYSLSQDRIIAGGPSGNRPARSSGPLFTSWSQPASWPLSLSIRMVAYSPDLNLWIAGTENAEVGSSTDGASWTLRSAMTGFVRAGVWSPSLGLFVAAGASTSAGSIRTSPDGVTWTSQTNPGIEASRAEWSPELGLFVLVGRRFVPSTVPAAATSPDGVNWTMRSMPGTLDAAGFGWAIEWSPQLGLFVVGTTTGELVTSPDGINWTERTSPFGTDTINDIAWSPPLGMFVAVSGSTLATSSDGITWTTRTHGFGADSISEVLWAGSLTPYSFTLVDMEPFHYPAYWPEMVRSR